MSRLILSSPVISQNDYSKSNTRTTTTTTTVTGTESISNGMKGLLFVIIIPYQTLGTLDRERTSH